MSKIKQEIDLSGLPKKTYGDKERIDWKNSVGYKCKFIYEDIEDEVEIIGYKDYKVIFKYGDNIDSMFGSDFSRCKLGKILNRYTKDFKIKIGEVVECKNQNLRIIDRLLKYKNKNKAIKYYKYECLNCGYYDGIISEYSLLSGNGCSCCRGLTVVPGINDIVTTDPWMVKFFQGGEDEAKLYTKSSRKDIYPICPDCGRVKTSPMKIYSLYENHSINCICGDGINYPEKVMYNLLKYLNIYFIFQLNNKDLKWCKDKKYDFLLTKFNAIIETNGMQHYKESTRGRSLKEEQCNDKFKKKLALNNGINSYVEIDCRYSNINWIKENILRSELSQIIDLSDVDWHIIEELSLKNIIKEVCDYYENHKNIMQIDMANIFNISQCTISRYLKKGEKLGWCTNVKERSKFAKSKALIKSSRRKILCVELNEEFESMAECCRQLSKRFNKNFNHGNISLVCSGKQKHYHGFTFKYV